MLSPGAKSETGERTKMMVIMTSFKKTASLARSAVQGFESPLYVNPVNVLNTLTKVLAEGKGGIVRDRLKEAGVQSYELTNRNSI